MTDDKVSHPATPRYEKAERWRQNNKWKIFLPPCFCLNPVSVYDLAEFLILVARGKPAV